jgi:hypothetical protein
VVWANAHPSFIYGLLVLACMTIDATVDDLVARNPAQLRTRWLQLVVRASSAFAVPDALEHFRTTGSTLADPVSTEWSSIAQHATHGHPWMYAFLALLGIWLGSLLLDRRARRSALTLLLAAVAVLAFAYSRFVVEFAIVASISCYRSCCAFAARVEQRIQVRPALIHALLGLGLLVAIEFETRKTYGGLALGLDVFGNPVSQAEFMSAHALKGKIFAPGRGDSAYLSLRLWPGGLIFIDGRVPQVFPLAFAELAARAAEPAVFQELVARYDIDHVVISKGTFSREAYGWAELLEQHGGFALVYWGERGMVWTRARPGGLACRGCRAFQCLKPWRTDHDWIVREFPKQPFDEVWAELSYLTRITRDDPAVRELIETLIEDGGAAAPDRERLKLLVARGTP